MLGAHELDSPYGRLVCLEGEDVARTEYLHKVVGPKSPRNICEYVDRPSVYPGKYFIKGRHQCVVEKLNKSVID